jgi:predicted MFS family arabinose efflux permease
MRDTRECKHVSSDKIVLIVMEVLLLSITLFSIIKAIQYHYAYLKAWSPAYGAISPQHVTFVFTMYGIAALVYTLAVQVARACKGNKVLLIIINYACLTYLFFFNVWFKQHIALQILNSIIIDKLN